ncbi:ArsR/SmtB family transcription factor [Frondihabitans cladoniiphilus]
MSHDNPDGTLDGTGSGRRTGRPRSLDASALRALAHPLRIEIYETLGRVGSATASGLAEQLGESSGSTSYHLRQLERHQLVREVEGKGTGRERWWQVVPGGVSVSAREHESAAGRKSARMVVRQWDRSRAALLEEFAEAAESESGVPTEWYDATSMATINVSATVEQLRALSQAFDEFSAQWIDPLRGPTRSPDERRVQVHFNAFPIPDAFLPAPETPASSPEGD